MRLYSGLVEHLGITIKRALPSLFAFAIATYGVPDRCNAGPSKNRLCMLNMFNPVQFVRRLTRTKASSEMSLQAGAIARWDNEGGASEASERQNISIGEALNIGQGIGETSPQSKS